MIGEAWGYMFSNAQVKEKNSYIDKGCRLTLRRCSRNYLTKSQVKDDGNQVQMVGDPKGTEPTGTKESDFT